MNLRKTDYDNMTYNYMKHFKILIEKEKALQIF